MKQRKRFWVEVCIILCCTGLLTGCGDSSKGNNSSETDENSTEATTESKDVIGKVSYVGNGYLIVVAYDSDTEVEDYTSLDVSTLNEGSVTQYIYINEDTEYYTVENQVLVSASLDEVKMDTMVVETTSDEDTQQIIILEKGDESLETEKDEDISEE